MIKGEWKTIKGRFEKMEAKKWWKKDDRKNGRIQKSKKTQRGVFCNEITKWSRWKIHKKKNIENEKKKKRKKNEETEKKGRSPKKRSKKDILSNAEEVKK